MQLKDSGTRREFETGAVRDINEGKGRCDLLPLLELGDIGVNRTLTTIGLYVVTGHTEHLKRVIREFSEDHYGNFATAMLEVAKHYEDGCNKYGERNWEKGILLHCYIDSGVRHYLKWLRGDTDEPHERAFLWNMLGAMWTQNHKPECCDLPFSKEEI